MKAKTIWFGAAAIAFLGLSAAALGLALAKPPVAGFYAVDNASAVAIKSLAASERFRKLGFMFVDMESPEGRKLPLVGKGAPALLFFNDGLLGAAQIGLLERLEEEPARAMPSALRRLGSAVGLRYAYPLAIDHFELAYDKEIFAREGLSKPSNLADFLGDAAALSAGGNPAIVCAGGEDAILLNLVGALVEAKGGVAAAEALTGLAYADGMLRSIMDLSLGLDKSGSSITLRTELDLLISLKAKGVLHPEWFRFKRRDAAAFMERGLAPFALMMLSDRRLLEQRIASRYVGSPFPTSAPGAPRALRLTVAMATINAAAPKRHKEAAQEFLGYLVSAAGQRQLAGANGLAPAHAAAETLDEQASELRLWAAAARLIAPEPGWALTESAGSRAALAAELRAYIEAGGAGY